MIENSTKSVTTQKLALAATKVRRGQIELLVEILTIASTQDGSRGATKSRLASKSGLNFRRFEKYLRLLLQRGLLEIADQAAGGILASPRVYRTTQRGERVLLILTEAEELILGDKHLGEFSIAHTNQDLR